MISFWKLRFFSRKNTNVSKFRSYIFSFFLVFFENFYRTHSGFSFLKVLICLFLFVSPICYTIFSFFLSFPSPKSHGDYSFALHMSSSLYANLESIRKREVKREKHRQFIYLFLSFFSTLFLPNSQGNFFCFSRPSHSLLLSNISRSCIRFGMRRDNTYAPI